MYVDNRFFVPFALPFVLLALARLLFWAAGAEWSDPALAARLSLLFGLVFGFLFSLFAWLENVKIGGFWIGRKP